MVDRFASSRTGPARAAGEPGAIIRRDQDGEVEMVNLIWGFEPHEFGARPMTLLRSEGRSFDDRRCIIPASEFTVRSGQGKSLRRWRVTLATGDMFYFAGIWRPATATWPAASAIVTIPANPDIAPAYHRQNAVILGTGADWLDHLRPDEELLRPLPEGTFHLDQIEGPPTRLDRKRAQPMLSF